MGGNERVYGSQLTETMRRVADMIDAWEDFTHAELDIVSSREIAERTGYSQTAVSNWMSRWSDWPGEVAIIAHARIFHWHEVVAVLRTHGKHVGESTP